MLRASNCCALIATLRAKLRPRASPALFELRDIPLDPTHDGRVSKLQSTFCHHLDEIPEAELITKVPTYTTGSPHDRSADPQTLPSFPPHYSYQHQAPQNNTVSEWGTRYLHTRALNSVRLPEPTDRRLPTLAPLARGLDSVSSSSARCEPHPYSREDAIPSHI